MVLPSMLVSKITPVKSIRFKWFRIYFKQRYTHCIDKFVKKGNPYIERIFFQILVEVPKAGKPVGKTQPRYTRDSLLIVLRAIYSIGHTWKTK